ncbi:hypothetical protein [Bacillus sp. V5-8f]|uniref:hypothetical protein n=1 Tax=Bacillus sp. V5-8f TaxID=2053044 RepID=UPI0015E13689|nr:hypothetical protein [Bacillus sp. V5-8f]
MNPTKGLAFDMNLVIKWYGWPFMMWKTAHKEYIFRWYEYPRLIVLITKHTLVKWIRSE